MAKKRITELTEATTVKAGHYIPVDHGTDGTQKMSMSTLIDSTLSTSGKAADAKATGDSITELDARMDTFTSLPSGSTSGDAELMDIRVGADGTTYQSAGSAVRGQISEIKQDLQEIIDGGGGSGMTEEFKHALHNILEQLVYISADGQTYLDALDNALWPPTNLASISCVYTQSGIVKESDSLDTLKVDLVVTAHFDNGTTRTVTDYILSGTLTEGTSTITVTYGGKTATFNVTVSSSINYVAIGNPTIANGILTVENGKYVRSNYALSPTSGQSWKIRQKFKYNNLPTGFVNIIGGSDADAFAKTFVVQENSNHQYIMYFSADMSAWTVSNQYTDNMPLAVDTWYYFEIGYTGTKYYMELKTGGWDGTRVSKGYKETTSNVLMYGGKYVGFGVTSTVSGFDGQIDLNDCSIYVDDALVWQAIA